MNINFIKLENFKRFNNSEFEFKPGLNTVFGHNEQGKSTILFAIFTALFTDCTTRSKKVLDDIKSWDSNMMPRLELKYGYNSEEYTLIRDFSSRSQSIKDANENVLASSAPEISQLLHEHMGISNEEIFRLTALVGQNDIARVGDPKEKSVKDLHSGIQESLVGSENVSIADVIKDVDKELSHLEKGLRGSPSKYNGVIKELEEERVKLEEDIIKIKSSLQTFSSSAKEQNDSAQLLSDLEKELEALQSLVSNNEKRQKIETRLSELDNLIQEKISTINEIEKLSDRLDVQREELKALCGDFEIDDIVIKVVELNALIGDKESTMTKVEKDFETLKNPSPGGVMNRKLFDKIIVPLFLVAFSAFLSWKVGFAYIFLPLGFVLAVLLAWTSRSSLNQKAQNHRSDEIKSSLEIKRKEVAQILKEAGVSSEKELLELNARVRVLRDKIKENEGALSALLTGKQIEEIREIETKLIRQKKELEMDLTDEVKSSIIDQKEVFAKKKQLAALESRKQELEKQQIKSSVAIESSQYTYDDLNAADEKLSSIKRELGNARKRARTLRNVRQMIVESKEEVVSSSGDVIAGYMEKYLPIITEGRYKKIRVGEGLQIQIFSEEKSDWVDPVDSLSQGTIDQIYLIARIAILSIIGNKKFPPIILDDPFVTFDEQRQLGVLKVLEDLSSDYQILLLTCHKDFNSWGNLIKL